MIRRCTGSMKADLLYFLKRDAAYHTFLLADIENFGFDKDFQTVYADLDGEEIKSVYLKFYGNLIVAGGTDGLSAEFLSQWFKDWKPDVVMGKETLVREIHKLLPDYDRTVKNLYLLENGSGLLKADSTYLPRGITLKIGKPGDEDKIHGFLMEIPEIRALYTSKDMIRDRLVNGDGTHLYLEKDGEIIAHVNSAAKSPFTVMIGGAAVKESERGWNLEAYLVSALCKEILKGGRRPCVFCDRENRHNLFVNLGFEKTGLWGTLTRKAGETDRIEETDEMDGLRTDTQMSSQGEDRLPSYIPVYNRLYQDISDGVYEKDSLLPGENALAAAYKVSRNTLRQALTILCQDGYIYKRQGKGTFVSYDCHKKEKQHIYNFLKECAKEEIIRITADHNTGLPTNIARRKLTLEYGEEVLASNNVYWGSDGPMGQAFLQIPCKLLKQREIKAEDNMAQEEERTLLEFMDCGLYRMAVSAHLSVQIMEADDQVIPYMNLPEGTILLHIEQILYGLDESPIARIKYFFIPEHYQVDCRLQA